jgi:O-antigen/teichoic acid export membrane protein
MNFPERKPVSLGKQVASATFQLTLSNALVRLLSLVTMPILTRLLPPAAYGTASMAGTMISICSVIALSGMDMSYARAYHSKMPPFGTVVETFAWRYTLGTGLAAAGIGAIVWWLFADIFELPTYLAALLGVGILLSLANAMAKTRARLNNRYRLMSMSIVLSSIGAVAVSLGVALWWRQDELPLILSVVMGYLIPVLLLGIPSCVTLYKPSGLSPDERKNVLKIGLAGIVTAPMYWVISSLDRWFLGYYEDAASVGIYSIGYSVGIMGMMVNNALTSVWLPEVSRAFENNQEEAKVQLGYLADRIVAGLAVVWLAITAAGGDAVRLLASPKFHDASLVIPFIAGAVFFHGLLHLAKAGLLLKKKLHHSVRWYLAGAVLCVIMNMLLIPTLGRLGAAITQTAAFAVIAIGIIFNSQRLYPVKLRTFRLTIILFSIVILGMLMRPAWYSTPWISLLIKFPVGLMAAFLVFEYMAPNIIRSLTQKYLAKLSSRNK